MRLIISVLLCAFVLSTCTKALPPVGRWEGTFQSGSTFVAARLELADGPSARIYAADVTDPNIATNADRLAMEQNLADRLAGAWGEVAPSPLAFDGITFRAPDRTAPLMVWDPASNAMTLYVYLAAQKAVLVSLHPVADFSASPWPASGSLGK